MTLADEIRALLKTHGPLTSTEIRALLPDRRNADGSTRRTRAREVHSRLHAMCQPARSRVSGAILARQPDDRYRLLRELVPVMTKAEAAAAARETRRRYEQRRAERKKAERHARGLVPLAQRALRINPKREADYSARQSAAAVAQAVNRRTLGLRDMPADVRPCTESWLAANADKVERLPSCGPLAVSPASRLRYTYG